LGKIDESEAVLKDKITANDKKVFHPPLMNSKAIVSMFVLIKESAVLACSSRCSCAQKRNQYVPLKITCKIEWYLTL
jgi:hypothetical protein